MEKFDKFDSMYPSTSMLVTSHDIQYWPTFALHSAVYGYSFGETNIELPNKIINIQPEQYFSFYVGNKAPKIEVLDETFFVIRLGYKCRNIVGDMEDTGRLTYLDGCSTTNLISPDRRGDPGLYHLHFPSHINQTFHRHPTIRLGVIINGEGTNEYMDSSGQMKIMKLSPGTIFCLDEQQEHRFITENRSLDICIYHPDSEVGPTDEAHNMLLRSYLTNRPK
jgi:hypothetical protein